MGLSVYGRIVYGAKCLVRGKTSMGGELTVGRSPDTQVSQSAPSNVSECIVMRRMPAVENRRKTDDVSCVPS